MVIRILLVSSIVLFIVYCNVTFADTDTNANPAHETLWSQDLTSRKRTLTRVLKASGKTCRRVVETFYQGLDENRAAYWNARCRNGSAFMVQFPRSRFENINILSCETMSDAGISCFEKHAQFSER
jgi:hypothetical protein